jgi:hypothetical protein
MAITVNLELTTACNFACFCCPLPALKRKPATLPTAKAIALIKEVDEDKLAVGFSFHQMGEALLHPDCVKIVRRAHELGLHTRLVTNGSLHDKRKLTALFDVLDVLDISYRYEGGAAKSGNLTAAQYKKSMESTIELRRSLPGAITAIRMRVFDDANNLAAPWWRITDPWFVLVRDQQFVWPSAVGEVRPPAHPVKCARMDTRISILADGSVTTCCWDAEGGNTFGNIFNARLKDILSGPVPTEYARLLRRGVMPTATCRACVAESSDDA